MIKNLKSKFLICLFLLVTVFSVTSSCFASVPTTFKFYPQIKNPSEYTEYTLPPLPSGISTDYVVIQTVDTPNTLKTKVFGSSSYYVLLMCSNTIEFHIENPTFGDPRLRISSPKIYYLDSSSMTWTYGLDMSGFSNIGNIYDYDNTKNGSRIIYSSKDIYAKDDSSVCLWSNVPPLSVDVVHEFQSDTSAKVNFTINNASEGSVLKYSLTGVEISTDLTAPLQLRNPVTYTPRSNKFSC